VRLRPSYLKEGINIQNSSKMRKTTLQFLFIYFLALTMALPCQAFEKRDLLQKQTTKEALVEMLIKEQAWVDTPDYTDREGWDALLDTLKSKYIRKGEQYLNYNWQVVTASMYREFSLSGNRSIMERPQGANNGALAALFYAELAEGKGRFIPGIIDGVFFMCEQTSWALSAHIPHGNLKVLPDHRENTVDLMAAEVSTLMSWIYYYFHEEFDKIDQSLSPRLKSELKRRITIPYMTYNGWWVGIGAPENACINNWNPWINFNVLQTFLLIEEDPQVLADGVWRTMQSVDEFLNRYKEDGCCDEGPSYWTHAAGELVDYLSLLQIGTKGKISIFDNTMIRNMGEYISRAYVGKNWVVNFADASAHGPGGSPSLIYRYGKAVGSEEMMQFAASLKWQSELSGGTQVFRAQNSWKVRKEIAQVTPAIPSAPFTWYPETEVCMMRNEEGLMVAAKGGHNNESHNHNDVGSFCLWMNQEPVFIDLGVETYSRKTFSGERYDIWTMQSEYHNLPRINGHAQRPGGEYRSASASFDAKKMAFTTDIAPAYPKEANVKMWKRTCQLKKNTLLLTEQFQLTEAGNEPNIIRLMVWKEPKAIKEGTICIQTETGEARLIYDASQLTAQIEPLEVKDGALKSCWKDMVYRISLQAKKCNQEGTYRYRIETQKK